MWPILISGLFLPSFPFPHESSRALLGRLAGLNLAPKAPNIPWSFRYILSHIPSVLLAADLNRALIGSAARPDGLVDVIARLGLAQKFAVYDPKDLIRANTLVASACAGIAQAEKYGFHDFASNKGNRISGPCGNPTYLAAYLMPSAFLALGDGLKGYMASWFMFYTALTTKSKLCHISFLAGLAGLTAGGSVIKAGWSVLAYFTAWYLALKKNDKINRTLDFSSRSTSGRRWMWTQAWKAFKSKPFFGHGLNCFNHIIDSTQAPNDYDANTNKAHSNIMEKLACTGVVGVLGAIRFHLGILFHAQKNHVRAAYAANLGACSILFRTPVSFPLESALIGMVCHGREKRPNILGPILALFGPKVIKQAKEWNNTFSFQSQAFSPEPDYTKMEDLIREGMEYHVNWVLPKDFFHRPIFKKFLAALEKQSPTRFIRNMIRFYKDYEANQ